MRPFSVTADDLAEIAYDRYHHPVPLVQKRMEVVWLYHHGQTQAACAALAGVSHRSVQRYLDAYRDHGLAGLRRVEWRGPESELAAHAVSLEDYFLLRLPRRRRGQCTATSKDVVAAVRVLARTCTDRVIAGVLNRNGLRTCRGNRWTAGRVVTLRNWNGIPVNDADRQRADGWLNLTDAAAFLGVAANTLRLAVEQGRLQGEHPLADGPWVLRRADLETESARRVVERARRQAGTPGSGPLTDGSPSLYSELTKGAE